MKFIVFTSLLGLIFSSVQASELNSFINIEVGSDEQGNKNSAIAVVLGMDDGSEVEFGLGRSEIPLQTNDKTNSHFIYIGLTDSLNEDWNVGVTLDSSGQRNAYTQLAVNVPFTYSQDNYSIGFVPVFRNLVLTTNQNNKVRINSPGLGIKGSIYPGDHFRFSASFYGYRYSRDVSKLASFGIARFFSEKTLLLSSGVLKSSANLEAGLDFESWSVSLGRYASVSAIDNSRSTTGYLVLDFYLSDAWTVSVSGGRYDDVPADEDSYSSLAVNYRF